MNLHPIDNELVTGYLKGHSIPERSQLYALTPVESPPEQRESLISLLVRTSGAHSVNPRRLIAGVFAKAAPEIEALMYPTFFNRLAGTINGHGKYANLFVQVLEDLTGQHGLARLTLLPWRDVFPHNGQGMLSRHPRWCSACLLEQRRTRKNIYFQLRWSLEVCRYCTIHRQSLDDRCPHCGKQQPFLPRYPDQAICHHCLRSLIHVPAVGTKVEVPNIGQFEAWVAKALGNMLVQHNDPAFTPSAKQFHTAVQVIIESVADGNRAAFCRAIGFNEHALKNWLTKGERPSITQFLALSYAVQVAPVELAMGNTGSLALQHSAVQRPKKLKIRKRCQNAGGHHRIKFKRWLQEELQAEPPHPISVIAKRWGVTAQYLRYWFPDSCRELTIRYKESLRQGSTKRLSAQIQRVHEIVREIRENNCYPSRRKVDTTLREAGASLGKRILFDAYRAALEA